MASDFVERLQVLATSRGTSVIDVVHVAIDALKKQEFLQGSTADYGQLREGPERWEQCAAERREWDLLARSGEERSMMSTRRCASFWLSEAPVAWPARDLPGGVRRVVWIPSGPSDAPPWDNP